MNTSEQELRAALDGALSIDKGFLPGLLAKFEELQFLPNNSAIHCSSLRGRLLAGDGEVGVYFSPAGRVLTVAAQYHSPDFSATITYRLPREYWPAEQRAAVAKLRAAHRKG